VLWAEWPAIAVLLFDGAALYRTNLLHC